MMKEEKQLRSVERDYWVYGTLLALAVVLFVFVPLSLLFTKEEFEVLPYRPATYFLITDEVYAEAAVIYDISTATVIAGKEVSQPKSIASITKLITALLAYPRLDEGDETVLDSSDFALTPNTSLSLGDRWNTLQLLEYALITSSNRGIHAIQRTVEKKTDESLISLMNTFARENNLTQTHFVNATGLDRHATLSGSESSALNLATLAGILVTEFPDLALLTTRASGVFYSLTAKRYSAKNTNSLIATVSNPLLLSKTGYTDLAGGALIMVLEYDGRAIAFVILGSTKTKRFEDMQSLFTLYQRLSVAPDNPLPDDLY